ncbi:MAG TPA: Rrf2 family transcriptional regulator [Actinomycetota bacterium]
MNLTLTRRGDYTVRAAIHLARRWGDGLAKLREISADMELPRSYTPQVLGILVRAGLAEAKAGRDGGYQLVRDPASVSLLEVVEAADGPLRTTECTLRGGSCRWDDACAVHPSWVAASEAFRGSLGSTSLADVAGVEPIVERRGAEG